MGYIISRIIIQNFKYVSMEKPLEVELGKKNLIVLSGQNGYGKTTLFDAIELVLTGECKRLETIRKNQREDNIKQLAMIPKKILFLV